MPLEIHWHEIAERLFFTVFAGVLMGLNREEHGRPAGLRTTLLVCLAAAIAMIQVNLLLPIAGKARDSFVVMDLMRLPLGILSGIGFIGAGAILRRNDMVLGVTTAATMWFVTVMGLCFGGGQIGLGLAALVLGLLVLTSLKWVERRLRLERHGTLTLVAGTKVLTEQEVARVIAEAGYQAAITSVRLGEYAAVAEMTCAVRWRSRAEESETPAFLRTLAAEFDLARMEWRLVA